MELVPVVTVGNIAILKATEAHLDSIVDEPGSCTTASTSISLMGALKDVLMDLKDVVMDASNDAPVVDNIMDALVDIIGYFYSFSK